MKCLHTNKCNEEISPLCSSDFQLPIWFPCSDLSRGSHTSKSRLWSAHQEVKNLATLSLTFLSQDGLEVIERGKSLSQQWKGLVRMLCHFPSVAFLRTFYASVFIKVVIISSTTCILARCLSMINRKVQIQELLFLNIYLVSKHK